jgi:adenylate kinase
VVSLPLALSGTPGTGKKTLAPLLATSLGFGLLALNDLAGGDHAVDTRKLRRRLLKEDLSEMLVYGHLVPDVLRKGEVGFVAVLRCEPAVLKGRLAARGYAGEKLVANVEAELIGVVLDSAVTAFGEGAVHEYDGTSSSPSSLAERICEDFRGGASHRGGWTDWTLDYDSSTRLRSLLSTARTDPAST